MSAASSRARAGAGRLLASYGNWSHSSTAVRQAENAYLAGLGGQSAARGGCLLDADPTAGAMRVMARWLHQQHAGGQLSPRVSSILREPTHAAVSSQLMHVRGLAYRAGGRPDIGARARALQQKRLWSLALGGSLLAGFVILVLNTFQENLMFYITPTQALEKFAQEPSKNRFRLGGLVLEGSVRHFANDTEMEFVVTDLATEILVRYRGALPDLFREGHSVVAEGFLKALTEAEEKGGGSGAEPVPGTPAGEPSLDPEGVRRLGCYFAASEVLAKHDEKYMPKEVAAAVARNKAALEAAEAEAPAPVAATLQAAPPSRQASRPSKLSKVAQAPPQAQQYDIAG